MVKNNISKKLHAWKQSLFIFMSLMSIGQSLSAQCPSGSVYLTSQTAVNDFINNYPDCTAITGNLVISSASVTDISGLNNKIKNVTGLLSISSTSLTNLNGLQGIETIGSSFTVNNNDSLSTLAALSNLTSVGNGLNITGNDAITTLSGIENISTVASIKVTSNYALADISVFSHLTNVNFDISVGYNNLTDLQGLHNLITVKNLTITEPNLPNLNDLDKLRTVDRLIVQSNSIITSLEGLENITSVDEILFSDLTALGDLNYFPNVSSLPRLKLRGLNSITNLTGLNALQTVSNFEIESCSSLASLSGITNLDSVVTLLSLKYLPISNLSGAENITSLSDLTIDTCDNLVNLTGLTNVTALGDISITDAAAFENFNGLTNTNTIESVTIDNCDSLSGFVGLKANSTDTIEVKNCDAITNLSGLSSFTTLASLTIQNCSTFSSLNGIQNLASLDRLSIRNTGVTSMTGFPSISSVNYILILDNTSLTSLDGFESLTEIGQINISGNGLLNVDGLQNLVSLNPDNSSVDHYLAEDNLQSINLTALRAVNGNYWSLYIPNTTDVCGMANYASYGSLPSFWSFYADSGNYASFDQVKNACAIQFSAKLYLEGAMKNVASGEEHLMRDDLRVNGIIPSNSPYADGVNCDPNVFNTTGETAIIDWIVLQLRDGSDPTNIIQSKSFLLQRNGTVIDPENNSTNLTFSESAGTYFISVSHRNHLAILSNTTVALSATTTNVDFTNSTNVLGGTAALNLVYTDSGTGTHTYAIIAGDNDENGQIQNIDISYIIQVLGSSGYLKEDLDLNGQIQNTDITNILNTNIGKGEQF
ncbi:exported hypothetical protein [Tenacibaculum sp. 190524A05c]|uniref:hypothetical protein n=1 Tax=Tenacibaculum platacis TaxID=3137852 RepID=UPI0031FAD887